MVNVVNIYGIYIFIEELRKNIYGKEKGCKSDYGRCNDDDHVVALIMENTLMISNVVVNMAIATFRMIIVDVKVNLDYAMTYLSV